MATILNFDAFRQAEAASHWVDPSAGEDSPPLRGWLRDLAGIAEVLFADDIGPPDRSRIRWVCAQTQGYADAVGPKAKFVFRVGVAATSWVAPLLIMRVPPLRRLPYRERLRALKRYEETPVLGLSLFAVKVFLGVSWFEHPEVAREVNFDGQCRGASL